MATRWASTWRPRRSPLWRSSSAAEGFWVDLAASQKILQRISQLKSRVADYRALKQEFEDALTLIELANEEEDESLLDEVREGVDVVIQKADAMAPDHPAVGRIRRETTPS